MSITLHTMFLGAFIGAGVSWVADRLSCSPGFGRFLDSILGIVGAVAALWYAARIGLPAKLVMVVVGAAVGAALLLLFARLVVLYRNRPTAQSPIQAPAAPATKGRTIAVDRSPASPRAARTAAR